MSWEQPACLLAASGPTEKIPLPSSSLPFPSLVCTDPARHPRGFMCFWCYWPPDDHEGSSRRRELSQKIKKAFQQLACLLLTGQILSLASNRGIALSCRGILLGLDVFLPSLFCKAECESGAGEHV